MDVNGTAPVPLSEPAPVYLLLCVIPCLTLTGNLLVIVAVLREKCLQSVTNYFIVSLATADSLVALLVMPFGVYSEVERSNWQMGGFACNLYILIDVCCSTASILNLFAISVDRFVAITRPIYYSRAGRSLRRGLLTIAAVWLTSLAIALPVFVFNRLPGDTEVCLFVNPQYIIGSSIGSFWLPCMTMTILYVVILKKLYDREQQKKREREARRPKKTLNAMIASLMGHARLARDVGKRLGDKADEEMASMRKQLREEDWLSSQPTASRSRTRTTSSTSDSDDSSADYDFEEEDEDEDEDDEPPTHHGRKEALVLVQKPISFVKLPSTDEAAEFGYVSPPLSPPLAPTPPAGHGNGTVILSEREVRRNPFDSRLSIHTIIKTPTASLNGEAACLADILPTLHTPKRSTASHSSAPVELLKYRSRASLCRQEEQQPALHRPYSQNATSSRSFGEDDFYECLPYIDCSASRGASLRKSAPTLNMTELEDFTCMCLTPYGSFKLPQTRIVGASPDAAATTHNKQPADAAPSPNNTAAPKEAPRGFFAKVACDTAAIAAANTPSHSTTGVAAAAEPSPAVRSSRKLSAQLSYRLTNARHQVWSQFKRNVRLSTTVKSIMPSSGKRTYKKEQRQIRKERKATHTLAVVLMVFLMCWIPFFTCHTTNAICMYVHDVEGYEGCIPGWLFSLFTWMGYLNSLLNPIIYTTFNPDYRRAFRSILTCSEKTRRR